MELLSVTWLYTLYTHRIENNCFEFCGLMQLISTRDLCQRMHEFKTYDCNTLALLCTHAYGYYVTMVIMYHGYYVPMVIMYPWLL